MATVYSNINMSAYNLNQSRVAASNLGVYYHSNETPAALVTKVKAK